MPATLSARSASIACTKSRYGTPGFLDARFAEVADFLRNRTDQ